MKEWENIITEIRSHAEMIDLKTKLDLERKEYKILPESRDIFNAFKLCPYKDTRIVILGQDPYPDEGHPHGLAFSSKSPKTPASLSNIFKEIRDSMYPGMLIEECFKSNNLSSWASQGVLLLNSTLTVRAGMPGSHKDIGWEYFTSKIFEELSNHPNALVFMLWGSHAKAYSKYILRPDHLILQSSHPSPLSAEKGFFGNMHFSAADAFLRKNFYDKISREIMISLKRERLHRITNEFFADNGIEIKTGNIDHLYNVMFEDIGLFFDMLIPQLKEKHAIDWKT